MDMSLAEDAQETMATLAPDRFFFMSPYRSFTTSGCFARYTEPAVSGDSPDSPFQQKLRQQFAAAKSQGIVNPILVGAIPFDTCQPSSLFIPLEWQLFSRQEKQRTARYFTDHQLLTVTARKAIPEQDAFEAMVARAAMLTATPDVDKVVLSRLIDITTDVAVDSGALLERLVAQNPVSYNFHVPLADGGVLLGASPELLLRKEGERFSSLPLAGSARRQPDDVLDREAGNRLLASQKDRHEHELVTQAMKQILRDRSTELQLPSSPQLITTPTLWHLGTPFEGKANAGENALTLACLLHPTPALSGFPHQVAKKLIAELEPFDRELFGGIVGWCDAEGNGEWVVTIRCAKLRGNQVRLFAGAGIVPASSPVGEWRETGVKLSTMLNVFGLH
ncbi:isochorismate synthase EntC [Salmonella enterica subsp. arizonae]|uniref:Isochorismate synthase EntC n=1 Tax=Salmonella enterica subsp. arizonae TaxID=59203 RepID=A0A5Y3Q211_SALER|nr:isochorismate synthase EntC [Salmonella enterica]EBH8074183.1 isochorismate synthase EntC [Salmonella bongori]ECE6853086.1 isochorismate synthase EntC [Salmonella enterica subsp. arizonae]ECU8516845.1 isochorismate synthase EntC [Salmonella enterica subsp. arizonae serovar 44:z4,z23,z32:-]EDY0804091.1 isochorismate synthase EntC [Salmonella enterica subsp. arizonae serovar 62:z4,z23:-]EIN8587445.1 isochorismate synthase EntC [Salmonella enterica subsp. arizonae serovar 41:z4,z23:-]